MSSYSDQTFVENGGIICGSAVASNAVHCYSNSFNNSFHFQSKSSATYSFWTKDALKHSWFFQSSRA